MTELTKQRKEFESCKLAKVLDLTCFTEANSPAPSLVGTYSNYDTRRIFEGYEAGRSSLESENERLREENGKLSELVRQLQISNAQRNGEFIS